MEIRAVMVDCTSHRWYGKVIRSVDRYLKRHFSDLSGNRTIFYSAAFQRGDPNALPTVALSPDLDGCPSFEIQFNAKGWKTKDHAAPLAIAQFLGGLIALSDRLGIPRAEIAERCASLGVSPAEALIGGDTPPPDV